MLKLCHEATTEAVKRARNGEGPTLIEGLTYRFEEHSLGLGRVRRGEYRTSEEISKWRERDSIGIHSQNLLTEEFCQKTRSIKLNLIRKKK